ncbi:hypothetical protein B0H16DRAFT_1728388 [Mycena metata]|uniref:Uncharacterized protein n=1 Tax=Mycena metata TaxID=1033252 RepID=A0AAD7IGQ2_9AGAR|nr:hypothetical protein B0H16DRAFT_1728388 [Mycena metata]
MSSNTADFSSVAALALNARPAMAKQHCDACGGKMGQLLQCIKGKLLENWARWFQKCLQCEAFFWHNFPTPLEHIPHDVQVHFVMRQSSQETGTGLFCQEDNCRNSSNQPRRANKECSRLPPRCIGCCKAAGGYRTSAHRVRENTPLQFVRGTGAGSTASTSLTAQILGPSTSSSSVSSSALTTFDVSIPSQTFARPLSADYARGFLSRHSGLLAANAKLEAAEKSKTLSKNSVHTVVWAVENGPSQKFTLVSNVPGELVPADHAVLAFAIKNGFIAYLESPFCGTWCVRDARVPISLSPGARVLLRTVDLTDERCNALDVEIQRLQIELSNEPAAVKTRALIALSGSYSSSRLPSPSSSLASTSSDISISAASTSESSTPPPPERTIAPLRFPLTWACDMEAAFSVFVSLRKPPTSLSLEAAFKKTFPQCIFKSPTVYKHNRFYKTAVKLNILAAFVAAGRGTGGKWSDVVKAIEDSNAQSQTVIDISDDDEDSDLEYNVMTMKKQVYKYIPGTGGLLQSGSVDEQTPCPEFDVLVLDTFKQGHRMKVHLGNYSIGPKEPVPASVALKRLTVSDHTPWNSLDMAKWTEGGRLAECNLMFQATGIYVG